MEILSVSSFVVRTFTFHKSLPALISHHSLIQKLFTHYSAKRHKPCNSWLATAWTETTRRPTYSMARAIGATAWQKVLSVNAIIFVATHSGSHSSHAPTSPMATLTRAIACHKRQQECHLSVDTSYKAHGVCIQQQYSPGMTCLLE